ncbi:hypothetical protein R3P38DRAFT_3040207 [Favolaschia claudopus]|uniref:Secreted protein n=1 Tax=Favolaschia claudopus TaxID=2862362 RepID=A0AAW0A9P1_9AGAR
MILFPLFLVAALRLGCPSPSRVCRSRFALERCSCLGVRLLASGVGIPQSRVALAAGCTHEYVSCPVSPLLRSGCRERLASYVSHSPELLLLRSRGRERLTAACGRA